MDQQFEWDRVKDGANRAKHRITFDEAITAFADDYGITIPDPDHSAEEQRWIIMGQSSRQRLLVVVYVEREGIIRLISARRATRTERVTYEGQA